MQSTDFTFKQLEFFMDIPTQGLLDTFVQAFGHLPNSGPKNPVLDSMCGVTAMIVCCISIEPKMPNDGSYDAP